MRNETDCPAVAHNRLQHVQNQVERTAIIVGIQASKAFVDEDGIETNLAMAHLDDIGQTERKRERRDEGFAAR